MSNEEGLQILEEAREKIGKRLPKNIEVEHVYLGKTTWESIWRGMLEDRLKERKEL